MNDLDACSTDDLLEMLPVHLHVGHNDGADENDRWRIFNRATGNFSSKGLPTVRALLIDTLTALRD